MATVRDGNQQVLLVVDVQAGVVAGTWEADRVVESVAAAVARARSAGVPVVWVQHCDEELPQGSSEWQLVPELTPAPGEPIVHKHFNSSFEETSLEDELARFGATHVVLAGVATNWCVRATAYGALDRGYDLTLLSDAHTTEDLMLGDGRVIQAADIVDELNTVMRWISFPGRTSSVASADQIEFDIP
jgi:nicotinamidase-related amidase